MLPSEVQNMQNNPEKKSGSFKKFLKDKGYYIVLILCVAAVGVSGYIFVKTAADQNRAALESNDSLSVPLTPSNADSSEKSDSGKSNSSSKPSKPAASTDDAAETVAPSEDGAQVTAPTAVTTVRPLAGDTIGAYSMDALAYNETTQDWRTHSGIDIAATAGDQVVAARDGTVSAVLDDDAFGKTVVVSHDGGYTTHYANLGEEVAVTVGQTVKAGDVLGTVGDSATVEMAEASHLHFAVYQNQDPVDPEAFLN